MTSMGIGDSPLSLFVVVEGKGQRGQTEQQRKRGKEDRLVERTDGRPQSFIIDFCCNIFFLSLPRYKKKSVANCKFPPLCFYCSFQELRIEAALLGSADILRLLKGKKERRIRSFLSTISRLNEILRPF